MPTQISLYVPVFRKLTFDFTWSWLTPEQQAERFKVAWRTFWMSGRPADHWEDFARQDWRRLTADLTRHLALTQRVRSNPTPGPA